MCSWMSTSESWLHVRLSLQIKLWNQYCVMMTDVFLAYSCQNDLIYPKIPLSANPKLWLWLHSDYKVILLIPHQNPRSKISYFTLSYVEFVEIWFLNHFQALISYCTNVLFPKMRLRGSKVSSQNFAQNSKLQNSSDFPERPQKSGRSLPVGKPEITLISSSL